MKKNIQKNIAGTGRTKAAPVSAEALLTLILLILPVFFFISCSKEKTAEPERLTNVRVALAKTQTIQPYLEMTGTLKADEETLVSSEVDGIVKKIYVDEGQRVAAGALLAEINPTDYLLDQKRADAALQQVQASLINARAEYKRKEALFQEELITRQQYDDISTRVKLAEADLIRVKALLEISRERHARTKIYAPMAGAIKEKKVSTGDFVRASMPVLQMIKIHPLKLTFPVREKDIAQVKIGQEVVFSVDAFPDKTFTGKVSLLYPHLEERNRTMQAQALTPNSDGLLKPGYFARARIYTQKPRPAIVAPLTALLYDGAKIRIFVVEGDKARERFIKAGDKYGEYVEVLEGLKEKEQIVVVGQNNLSEGVKVNVAR